MKIAQSQTLKCVSIKCQFSANYIFQLFEANETIFKLSYTLRRHHRCQYDKAECEKFND